MYRLFVHIGLLIILLFAANRVVLAGLPFGWAVPLTGDKLAFYEEHNRDYNTLLMGSSHIYRHIDPNLLDEALADSLGASTFNMGIPAYLYTDTEELYRIVAESKSPNLKYVFFELTPPRTQPVGVNMHTSLLVSSYSVRNTILILSMLLDQNLSYSSLFRTTAKHIVSLIEKQFNIGLGPDILEYVFRTDAGETDQWKDTDGFLPLDAESSEGILKRRATFESNPQVMEKRTAVSREAYRSGQLKTIYNRLFMDRLDELMRLSDEKGIQLIFLLGPRMNETYTLLIPVYNNLPAENRISIADPDQYPQFYSIEMSFDEGHLNAAGAREFTQILADKLETVLTAPTESASK